MGILDWKHWLVILVVVVLVFGTKKLTGAGADIGASIRGFRKAMQDDESQSPSSIASTSEQSNDKPCAERHPS